MKKKSWVLLIIFILVSAYVTNVLVNSSNSARNYINAHHYYLIWSNGDIHTYTLNRVALFSMPNNLVWSLQDESPLDYLDKKITIEELIGFSLNNGLRYIYVMKTDNKVIGGYSNELKVSPGNGTIESMRGYTFGDLHKGTIQDWEDGLRKKLESIQN